ncbi:hypothetical protein [Corynebacterium sp. CCM 9203]|uniref:hypothetical protein n=1 Tax=Corynebacterium sp. CCM 9203 TaxID=3057615 RepID=UPI00352576EE
MLSETLILLAAASAAGAVALTLAANRRDAVARRAAATESGSVGAADSDDTDGQAVGCPVDSDSAPGDGIGESDSIPGSRPSVPDRAEPPDSSVEADGEAAGVIDVESEAQLRDIPVISAAERENLVRDTETPEEIPTGREDRKGEKLGPGVANTIHGGLHFPGSARRQRRRWASVNGYNYSKGDAFLTDEWTGGPAGAGAAAKDVVSGMASRYEFHLADLGQDTVLAFRRVTGSAVVVQMMRGAENGASILRLGDFDVFCGEPDVARRFVDERVTAALEALPVSVTTVWTESRWVIAQLARRSTPEDWDAALEPMALLADAACTLPPREGDALFRDVEGLDPSRPMPTRHEPSDDPGMSDSELEQPGVQPQVRRPDEPVELPSRVRTEQRGTVELRPVGGDEVDAIADGRDVEPQPGGVRVPRTFRSGPSIFTDSGSEADPDTPDTDNPTTPEEP